MELYLGLLLVAAMIDFEWGEVGGWWGEKYWCWRERVFWDWVVELWIGVLYPKGIAAQSTKRLDKKCKIILSEFRERRKIPDGQHDISRSDAQ